MQFLIGVIIGAAVVQLANTGEIQLPGVGSINLRMVDLPAKTPVLTSSQQ